MLHTAKVIRRVYNNMDAAVIARRSETYWLGRKIKRKNQDMSKVGHFYCFSPSRQAGRFSPKNRQSLYFLRIFFFIYLFFTTFRAVFIWIHQILKKSDNLTIERLIQIPDLLKL